ncbi:hypothetical protein ABKW28_00100 [Nocardioides sp. 31GB23]|uniref:hypothetical protein n=1 Tax=Nocardioides sp. 31GB23 TaxID=3156065 RepID=UPI0032AF9AF7
MLAQVEAQVGERGGVRRVTDLRARPQGVLTGREHPLGGGDDHRADPRGQGCGGRAGDAAGVDERGGLGQHGPGRGQVLVDRPEVQVGDLVELATDGLCQAPGQPDRAAVPDGGHPDAAPGEAVPLEVPAGGADRRHRGALDLDRGAHHVGQAAGHPALGVLTRAHRRVAQVEREEPAGAVVDPGGDQRVAEVGGERAPGLGALQQPALAVGTRDEAHARALGGEDAPGGARSGRDRDPGLVEDRQGVEVRLDGAGQLEVVGAQRGQALPQRGGGPRGGTRHHRAERGGQLEVAGHVAALGAVGQGAGDQLASPSGLTGPGSCSCGHGWVEGHPGVHAVLSSRGGCAPPARHRRELLRKSSVRAPSPRQLPHNRCTAA